MITKLKLIFLPFLIVAVAFIVSYTFFDWLFTIKYPILNVKENIVQFWIPAIGFLVIWILILTPRINLLKQFGSRNNGLFLVNFLPGLAIWGSVIISQMYLHEITGKLTGLNYISEIYQPVFTKYYTVKEFYASKKDIGIYTEAHTTDKYGRDLGLFLNIAVPLFDKDADTGYTNVKAWLTDEYSETINNDEEKNVKENEFQAFYKKSITDFYSKYTPQFTYLERVTNSSNDIDDYSNAVKNSPKYIQGDKIIILEPRNKPFADRTGSEFAWIFISFGIGTGIFLLFLIFVKLDDKKHNNKVTQINSNKLVKQLLIPNGKFLITPSLVWANLLVYIIMIFKGADVISIDSKTLLDWGANYAPLTFNGQWWRLFTCMFLHNGLMHIVNNMIGLFLAGFLLEPVLGKIKFALVYFTTGFVSSVVSAYWHPYDVVIGASGAIFGLYGVLLLLLIVGRFGKEIIDKSMLTFVVIFVGYNLLIGMFGNTDNSAHIGGFVSGILFGMALYPFLKDHVDEKRKEIRHKET